MELKEDKKNVRLQVFVTEDMDIKLSDLSELMGMRKNELIRFAIAQLVMGYNLGVQELQRKCRNVDENSPSV